MNGCDWSDPNAVREYKRIRAKERRERIKSDPSRYADYLSDQRKWGPISRAKRTQMQRETIRLSNQHWRMNNRERDRANKRNHRIRLRQEVVSAYGGRCVCCGEDRIEFLSIDHIGGGGNKHRKSLGRTGYHFYYWLRRKGYPEGFRVLCHNCNQSWGHYGHCPHLTGGETVDGHSPHAR